MASSGSPYAGSRNWDQSPYESRIAEEDTCDGGISWDAELPRHRLV